MIFFDLDGTLLDDDSSVRAGITAFLKAFGSDFPEDPESFLTRWRSISEKHFQSFLGAKKETFWGQRRARMREVFERDLSDEEADSRFKVYLEAYNASWQLYPDVRPCLAALAERQMGLITNGDGEQQRAKLQRLGLEGTFSVVVISREVGCAKPERAIFELAARQGKVAIEDCTYVGDRLDADALGSRDAGMEAIWLNRREKPPELPTGITLIRGLQELPVLLTREHS